jgi:hypothetical protein
MCPLGTNFFSIRPLGVPTRFRRENLLPRRDVVALAGEEIRGHAIDLRSRRRRRVGAATLALADSARTLSRLLP